MLCLTKCKMAILRKERVVNKLRELGEGIFSSGEAREGRIVITIANRPHT